MTGENPAEELLRSESGSHTEQLWGCSVGPILIACLPEESEMNSEESHEILGWGVLFIFLVLQMAVILGEGGDKRIILFIPFLPQLSLQPPLYPLSSKDLGMLRAKPLLTLIRTDEEVVGNQIWDQLQVLFTGNAHLVQQRLNFVDAQRLTKATITESPKEWPHPGSCGLACTRARGRQAVSDFANGEEWPLSR